MIHYISSDHSESQLAELQTLYKDKKVLIRTENGFWLENRSGYCYQNEAHLYDAKEAIKICSGLGPEKSASIQTQSSLSLLRRKENADAAIDIIRCIAEQGRDNPEAMKNMLGSSILRATKELYNKLELNAK